MNNFSFFSKNMCRIFLSGLIFISQASLSHSLPNFIPLVEKNVGAVVNISTSIKGKQQKPWDDHQGNLPYSPDDFLHKFFGQLPDGLPRYEQKRSSLGSGFIVSEEGYVITNSHVIKDASEIVVRLNDGREFMATVFGVDTRSDVAVLKIDVKGLPVLKLGDSAKLKVGEWVLAIGSPFGFDHSATQGVVSAIGRSLPNENYVPFIQTDVVINPGNSGGPLFNLQGEVIGVNSQIYSRTGGFMGVSFAIPSNVIKDVYHQLRTEGYVSRGWLGVLIQDVTHDLAESFAMERAHGALIAKVLAGSPAEKAGFMVGDVIVNFNGNDIRDSSELPPIVGATKVGKNVPVAIIRRGKTTDISVKLAELPSEDKNMLSKADRDGEREPNALNILVDDLTTIQRKQAGIHDHGVLISHVSAGPAYQAGLRQHDVILSLNNVKVQDVAHFQKLVSRLPKNKSFPVLLQRRGEPIFLALKL